MPNYFYNGIELPDIDTVWTDKATYRYAYIAKRVSTDKEYWLCLTEYPWTVTNDKGNFWAMSDSSLRFTVSGDAWITASVGMRNFYLLWSNNDIYYDDYTVDAGMEELKGTLYLAASDPVPVGGEPEQPEEPEPTLTDINLYRKINGKPTKLTLYKKVGGKLIPLDEYTKEVTHD